MGDDFPCTSCSLCCKKLNNVFNNLKELRKYPVMFAAVLDFPYDVAEDGSCSMLVNGKCSVYEDRPLLCNVRELGERMGVDRKTWYRLSADACNTMIRESDLDDSFLVHV